MKRTFFLGFGVFASFLVLFFGIKGLLLPSSSLVAGEEGMHSPGSLQAKDPLSGKTLGIPLSSAEGGRKQTGSTFLALRVLGESGGTLRGISVKFLHLETLDEGKGWTDEKGEFRVFSAGHYLFQLGGRGYVKEILPPVQVERFDAGGQGEERQRKEKLKIVRLKRGGELRVQLLRFSDGAPFQESDALLYLSSRKKGEERVSIHWRDVPFFSSAPFLSFAKDFLLPRKKQELGPKGFQVLLRSFKQWTGIQDEVWLPYVDRSFIVQKPDQEGVVSWKGLPDLPVRWGLKKREFSLQPNPPFEGKEIRVTKERDGGKIFSFRGRMPKDLSGRVKVIPGQVKFFKARVFSQNSVVVSVPKPKQWLFQSPPKIFTVMEESGDRYHGGAMETWGVEQLGKMADGRFVFENLSVGKKKEIDCIVCNPEKTQFSFLNSGTFFFRGGRMDLGSLHPMAGGDVRLRVVVDGGLEKAKKVLPLTVSIHIQGGPFLKDVSLGSKPLIFQGARGKTFDFLYPSDGRIFHDAKEGEKWKFVKRGPLDVIPGRKPFLNASSDLVLHLAPLHRVKVPFTMKIVEGEWLKGASKGLTVQSYPTMITNVWGPNFFKVQDAASPLSGYFVEDADQPHRLAVARLELHLGDWNSVKKKVRIFRGYSLSQTPPIFIPLKQCSYVQFIGMKKPDKDGTFFLQPKELFENPLAKERRALATTLMKRGKAYVTFNRIPLPGDYVIWESTPEKGEVVLKTLRIEKGTTKVDLR